MSTVKNINPTILKSWLDKNDCVLVDVRESKEYDSERIPSSKSIPLGTITKDKLPVLNSKKLVLHCGIGKRSHMACEKLLQEDPNLDIYNLEGGITGWKSTGYTTTKGNKKNLSIDGQIQITISIGVLFGVLLGYFVHPFFLLCAVFFSLILLIVGITGTPMLSMLMASMPWNKK